MPRLSSAPLSYRSRFFPSSPLHSVRKPRTACRMASLPSPLAASPIGCQNRLPGSALSFLSRASESLPYLADDHLAPVATAATTNHKTVAGRPGGRAPLVKLHE